MGRLHFPRSYGGGGRWGKLNVPVTVLLTTAHHSYRQAGTNFNIQQLLNNLYSLFT